MGYIFSLVFVLVLNLTQPINTLIKIYDFKVCTTDESMCASSLYVTLVLILCHILLVTNLQLVKKGKREMSVVHFFHMNTMKWVKKNNF